MTEPFADDDREGYELFGTWMSNDYISNRTSPPLPLQWAELSTWKTAVLMPDATAECVAINNGFPCVEPLHPRGVRVRVGLLDRRDIVSMRVLVHEPTARAWWNTYGTIPNARNLAAWARIPGMRLAMANRRDWLTAYLQGGPSNADAQEWVAAREMMPIHCRFPDRARAPLPCGLSLCLETAEVSTGVPPAIQEPLVGGVICGPPGCGKGALLISRIKRKRHVSVPSGDGLFQASRTTLMVVPSAGIPWRLHQLSEAGLTVLNLTTTSLWKRATWASVRNVDVVLTTPRFLKSRPYVDWWGTCLAVAMACPSCVQSTMASTKRSFEGSEAAAGDTPPVATAGPPGGGGGGNGAPAPSWLSWMPGGSRGATTTTTTTTSETNILPVACSEDLWSASRVLSVLLSKASACFLNRECRPILQAIHFERLIVLNTPTSAACLSALRAGVKWLTAAHLGDAFTAGNALLRQSHASDPAVHAESITDMLARGSAILENVQAVCSVVNDRRLPKTPAQTAAYLAPDQDDDRTFSEQEVTCHLPPGFIAGPRETVGLKMVANRETVLLHALGMMVMSQEMVRFQENIVGRVSTLDRDDDAELARLPVVTSHARNQASFIRRLRGTLATRTQCCICAEDDAVAVLHCGHAFCVPCVTSCREESRSCPACKHVADDTWYASLVYYTPEGVPPLPDCCKAPGGASWAPEFWKSFVWSGLQPTMTPVTSWVLALGAFAIKEGRNIAVIVDESHVSDAKAIATKFNDAVRVCGGHIGTFIPVTAGNMLTVPGGHHWITTLEAVEECGAQALQGIVTVAWLTHHSFNNAHAAMLAHRMSPAVVVHTIA